MTKRRKNLWQSLVRICRYRLVIPLLRSPHPPEFKARGVAVGMVWAMTPLVGIQMWLVFMTWAGAKKIFKWDFSLPLALAYTWVTNVFTLVPVYYAFYATGQILLGRPVDGYHQLKDLIQQTFLSDLGFVEEWVLFFKLLLKDWGVAMIVGCIPWAIVFGVMSYYLTMRFEQMRAARKLAKQGKKSC